MKTPATWRLRLEDAQTQFEYGQDVRLRTVRQAHSAGVSTRDIASVIGVSHETVRRMCIDPDNPSRVTLDTPIR